MNREDVWLEMIEKAKDVLKNSYSPYSGFPVGAAVLAASGKIFAAPNIENASYSLTVCAERNAIFQAVAAGERSISALVLYTPTSKIHTPCGACRQVIVEFLEGNGQVTCVAESGSKTFTVDELLPNKFGL